MARRIALMLMSLIGQMVDGQSDSASIRLTSHEAPDYHVKWSPDGKDIAFVSQRSGEPKIWIVRSAGGEPTLLETGLSGDHHISWSPDASWIAFDAMENGGPPNIWIIPVKGGKARKILDDRGPNFHPAWSPDGKRLAYCSNRDGNGDVRMVEINPE